MKARIILAGFLLVVPLVWVGCKKADPPGVIGDPDRTIKVSGSDAEMNAAMARARAEIDLAVAKLQAGADRFSVKVPVRDGGQTEYFWLSDVRYRDGVFTGKIDNDPDMVHTVKLGQEITAPRSEIADWMYFEGDKMHGNYTLRVLMKQMPAAEAEQYRRMLAD